MTERGRGRRAKFRGRHSSGSSNLANPSRWCTSGRYSKRSSSETPVRKTMYRGGCSSCLTISPRRSSQRMSCSTHGIWTSKRFRTLGFIWLDVWSSLQGGFNKYDHHCQPLSTRQTLLNAHHDHRRTLTISTSSARTALECVDCYVTAFTSGRPCSLMCVIFSSRSLVDSFADRCLGRRH